MEPEIRFCRSGDGTQIAYAVLGQGFPLVHVTALGSTIEGDWEFLDTKSFAEHVARGRQLVLYDRRGMGASQRDVDDFSMDANVADLEAVVDHLKLEQVDLFGGSEGAAIAAVYAARHPERVRRAVLFSSYARGPDLVQRPAVEAMLTMIRQNWSLARRAIADVTYPYGPTERQRSHARKMGRESSAEAAAELLDFHHSLDVTEDMRRIVAPTLVVHLRGNRNVPLEAGRAVASLIPNARFLSVEGSNSGRYSDVEQFAPAVREFLSEGDGEHERSEPITPAAPPGVSDTHTIFITDMEGSTQLAERLGDHAAQELRRTHNQIVRAALGRLTGSEIKHTGDGIVASFPTASAALECAIAVQRGMDAHRRERPNSPLAVYIGLNSGEPIAEEGDLFGTAVNLAARICDRAEPGQILVADVVRQLVAGKGFTFTDLGETRLKGFDAPVRLHEVRWEE